MSRLFSVVCIVLCLSSAGRGVEPATPLTAVLQELVDEHLVPGAVLLVADRERVLEVAAAGEADMVAHQPMPKNAVFWIASMSKTLTGAALMMLVDDGKVGLDDPVEKYLPEFRGQQVLASDGSLRPPKHPITVREVMCHTSGLVLAGEKTLKRTKSLQECVAEYARHPLRQEPGTKFEYNNSGINTGGRIIEAASGMSYSEFMQKRLFDPLGMRDTTFWPNAEQASRLAHTARRNVEKPDPDVFEQVKQDKNVPLAAIAKLSEGVPVPAAITAEMGVGIAADYAKRFGEPAGGYFSTAQDLGAFCQMLVNRGVHQNKRLMSEDAVRIMSSIQTGSVPVSPQEAYGVGCMVKIRDDERPSVGSFGHRGARRPVMWVDPTNGLAIILLVERFDMTGDEQKRMYGSVMKAAIARYGRSR